ncbi:heme-binding protein [Isosphaeraceae bacterium EP7]
MTRRRSCRVLHGLALVLTLGSPGAWAAAQAPPSVKEDPIPGTILLEPPKARKPAATPSTPAAAPSTEILDSAGMFSENALRSARAALQALAVERGVPVTIETVDSLRGVDVVEETRQRAVDLDRKGVYILIAKRDAKLDVLVTSAFRDRLPSAGRKAVQDALVAQFKSRQFDQGLAQAITSLDIALRQTTPGAPEPGVTVATKPAADAGPGASSPLVARGQVRLTLAGARRVLAAAEAEATRLNLKSNIAVVDDGGNLLAFIRMDGARPASVATATTKAIAAATFRQATGPLPAGSSNPDVLLNLGLENAAAAGGGRITSLLGGVPLLVEGQVIGAVGVAGSTGEQDAEVARAGLNALLSDLKAADARP